MQITDTQGRLIKVLNPKDTEVDMHGLSEGVYFLKTDKGSVKLLKI